jgi:hypothetical protein
MNKTAVFKLGACCAFFKKIRKRFAHKELATTWQRVGRLRCWVDMTCGVPQSGITALFARTRLSYKPSMRVDRRCDYAAGSPSRITFSTAAMKTSISAGVV